MKRLLCLLAFVLSIALTVPAFAQDGHHHDFQGIVANLQTTATGSTFSITEENSTLSVSVPTGTPVINKSNGTAATLANGQKVEVTGTYDSTMKLLTATKVVVKDTSTVHPENAEGIVANLQTTTTGSTFSLTQEDETLSVSVPTGTPVTNKSNGTAATLANGQKVEVTGTYDSTTKLLTATKVVVNDSSSVRPSTAEGKVASINATALTFVLTVKEASFTPTAATITVVTTTSTVITQHGKAVTFATLAVNSKVQVIGTFDSTTQTLTATKIEIGN